ncbi:hypothetical protein [Flammeovirga kamogawensis]|uniref:Helix-hairpin-helix domain-containing protein n=1 Tax=Flammeovirga kamogawensis TaxID=373891 RepID=A0ABX8GR21_9BACT|nr:hypothetical protein [Flammeovirga kamogawensis]MBB6462016.1 hypothetical protein [Flammeovirga kamogawensis]QWG05753.1 hypothetical protein KM029_10195 [Flammeovirga kamogawensis]TRX67578.1 hypothetical protein EO216_05215 [Flammeovirga kamogawensis]
MRYLLLVVLLFLFKNGILAQSKSITDLELLNLVFEDQELDDFSKEEIDYWVSLFHHPKNLNRIKLWELQEQFSLTYLEVESFKEYKDEHGYFSSTSELQRIDGWDKRTIKRVKAGTFVIQSTLKPFKTRLNNPDINYLIVNSSTSLPLSKGFSQSIYKGIPIGFQTRFRWAKKQDYSFSLTLDQDKGEPWNWEPKNLQYGIDHISANASIYNRGAFKKIMIGDYQMMSGQGLVFGGGYFLGKGGDPILNVARVNDGIRPYTSVSESGFMRGVATELTFGNKMSVTVLYSNKGININQIDSLKRFSTITNFRNDSEIEKKGGSRVAVLGSRLAYNHHNLNIGVNVGFINFDDRITPAIRTDSMSIFKGDQLLNYSFDTRYHWQNISVFSEFAFSYSNGNAFNLGAFIGLAKGIDWVLQFRNYASNYISYYGHALSENGHPNNERGFYTGFRWHRNKQFNFAAYIDLFSSPTAKYRQDAGNEGYEFRLNSSYKFNKSTVLTLKYSFKQIANYQLLNRYNKVSDYVEEQWTKVASILKLTINERLLVSPRLQVTKYFLENDSWGYLLAQDMVYKFNNKLQLSSRIAIFNATHYENRHYAYERNVQYSFSFPAYYGEGWKTYLLAKYKFGYGNSLSGRWGYTSFEDRSTISSGWNLVPSRYKHDLVLQLKLRL